MNFEHLAGKRALGTAYAKDYTDWAESTLHQNVVSKNVQILAGIGLERDPDSEEIEAYFQKSLKDLGLSLPSEKEGLENYAKYICEKIVSGTIDPEKGLGILETFYSRSDYEETIYSIWDELGEDILMVKDREEPIFNAGLNQENIESFIMDVAKQFLSLVHIKLPENFFRLCACPKCGYIGESEFERMERPWLPELIFKILYRRSPALCAICPKCREPFPINMSDYEGRNQYLSSQC